MSNRVCEHNPIIRAWSIFICLHVCMETSQVPNVADRGIGKNWRAILKGKQTTVDGTVQTKYASLKYGGG